MKIHYFLLFKFMKNTFLFSKTILPVLTICFLFSVMVSPRVYSAPAIQDAEITQTIPQEKLFDTDQSQWMMPPGSDPIIEGQSTISLDDEFQEMPQVAGKSTANPEYTFAYPHLGNLYLENIKYTSNNTIYVAGRLGWLAKSIDAGLTWEPIQTPFTEHIRGLDIKGDSIVAVFNAGLIAISPDDGLTWTTPESNVTIDFRAVTFAPNGNIYIAGNAQTLLYSSDNGASFSPIIVPDATIHNPNNKTVWNYQSIWVSGDVIMLGTGLPGIPIQIVRSADHGVTWTNALPAGVAIPASNIGAYVSDMAFADDGLTGYFSYWMLYNNGIAKTTDGGVTWSKVNSVDSFTPYPNPNINYTTNEVRFQWSIDVSGDGQKIVAGGAFGQVLASTNAGATWNEIFGGARYGDRDFRSVSFQGASISADGNSWIVAGQRGLVVGASNFMPATATIFLGEERPRNFHDIDFIDQNNGIAVGTLELQKYIDTGSGYYIFYDGAYFTTSDGGDSWAQAEGPGMENYEWFAVKSTPEKIYTAGVKYLYDYDEDENLIVFTHGLISSSIDNGTTWAEETTVPGAKVVDLITWGSSHIYALTNKNILLRKIDDGPWENITLPAPISADIPPLSIELSDPEVLFISGGRTGTGGSTYVLKSIDAGDTWQAVFTSTAGSLRSVSFVDGKHGFVSGQWGSLANRKNLLYSNDYGQTWNPTFSEGSWADYRELFFMAIKDSVSALGYGNRGFYGNTDDGANFVNNPLYFTEETFLGGYFNGASRLILVGENGTIVKYNGEQLFNSTPGKFANTFPVNSENIFIPWNEHAVFTWEEAIDPDGDEVTYVFILETADGSEELFRSEILSENSFHANTDNFPSIPPTFYRWRVEATDTHGLYSTSYPSLAHIEVDNFINDQNDILTFSFAEDFSPAEIDTENKTVLARVIYQTDVTALTPEITVSINATIEPGSGVQQDFSQDVTYVVTAENGDTQQWVVSVIVEDPIDYISITDFRKFDYSMIPVKQFPPLDFQTTIVNEAQRDLTDVTLTVSLNDNELASSQPLSLLNTGESATLEIDPAYVHTTTGMLNFWYEISVGEENANLVGHTAAAAVEVTDTVYATDAGFISNSVGSNSGAISLANIYEVTEQDYITSVTVGWGLNLHEYPLDFTIKIFKVDMQTMTQVQQVVPTQTFQRYPSMSTSLVSFDLPNTLLEPGHYAVVIEQLTSTHLRLAFSTVPGAYFYRYYPDQGTFSIIDDETFGFIILRANFGGLPLSTDATLDNIMVDGNPIEGFNPSVTDYTFILPQGSISTPQVTATANHEAATIDITPAADITSTDPNDRTTIIEVTAEDQQTIQLYSVAFEIATSITDPSKLDISFYPNPAGNFLVVRTNSGSAMAITLTSVDGRVVQRKNTELNNVTLDITSLPAGFYIISVISDGKVINETFSVIK